LGRPFLGAAYGDLMIESNQELLKTSCYDLHIEAGGKMVPFAGYEMPV
jgi:aminomethyltransferase